MKKFTSIIAAIAIVAILSIAAPAMAVDKIMDTKVGTITTALDKNGNEYVRILVPEDRKLQGVEYKVDVPVMVFGSAVSEAKKLKAGDNFKAVVASREYRGNLSYTVRTFLSTGSKK